MIIVLTVILALGAMAGVVWLVRGDKALPAPRLSWPARQIMMVNDGLPADNQVHDLRSMLEALDTKYGVDRVTKHFKAYRGTDLIEESNWVHSDCFPYMSQRDNFDKRKAKCSVMPEYAELIRELASLRESIEAQQRQLALSGKEFDLARAKQITEQLRIERGIVDDVTKEIAR